MLKWFAENSEGLYAAVMILGLVATYVIRVLVKLNVVPQATADAAIGAIEDGTDVGKRTIANLRQEKLEKLKASGKKDAKLEDVQLTDLEIAEAITKGLKSETRERAIKTGLKSVLINLRNRAAIADPKKTPAGAGLRILQSLRSGIPGTGG